MIRTAQVKLAAMIVVGRTRLGEALNDLEQRGVVRAVYGGVTAVTAGGLLAAARFTG